MSLPLFLSDSYHNPDDDSHSISDVADIITRVRTNLTGTGGNWTEPSTGLFKSYVDAAGRFMDVLLTRIDVDTLEMRVRNQHAITICTRRIDIEAAGNTTISYYWGDQYLVIVSERATAEVLQAFCLDVEPDDLASVGNYVLANGYRNNTGTIDGNGGQTGQYFAIDNVTATQANRLRQTSNGGGTQVPLISFTGRLLNFECLMSIVNTAAVARWAGRLPMCLSIDATTSFGSIKRPAVDQATARAFKVLPLTTINQNRVMIRFPSQDVAI